jgi:hypothetical protein
MRRSLDFYETAAWQVDALVDHLPELSGSIWCPCVGDGSLMRRLKERRPDLGPFVTNDIDLSKAADFHGDATSDRTWEHMIEAHGRPDWVVDNPPFNVETAIAKLACVVARKGVVLMSRISFPEGTKDRGPWLVAHPRAKQITLERYSFNGTGKSDSTTTEWLVWAKVPILNPGGYTAYGYKSGEVQRRYTELEVSA